MACASNEGWRGEPITAVLIGDPSAPGALANEAVIVDRVRRAHLHSTIGLNVDKAQIRGAVPAQSWRG